MIKRIIFDIDDTLIPWENCYYENLGKVFEKLGVPYTNLDITKIVEAIVEYEKEEKYFRKDAMLQKFNYKLGRTLPNNFVEVMLEYFSNCVPEQLPEETMETLSYLCDKYELVTLTNWFEETQKKRFQKLGLEKYFIQMYACETIKMKPDAESYYVAAGKQKPDECLMVGDSIKNDVEGAMRCNMQAIYYNPKGLPTKYPNIQTLSQLKEKF